MSGKPYPTAPPNLGYPQQSTYPAGYPQPQYPSNYPYQQPYGQPVPNPVQYASPNPPPYQEAPPPYSQYQPAPPPQPMYPQQPFPQTVIAPGLFDSGARFDGVSQARIPPPPPGVAPTGAQMAAMQGHQVIGTQQSSNWFSGGRNDGGYTWGF